MGAFDGLSFKKELTKVGIPADQAEAFSELIRDHVVSNAVNKDELQHVELRLSEKLDHVERRLDEKIDRVEERLRSEIEQLGQQMTIKLGSMIVGATVILLAALGLLATWLPD